MVPLQVEHKVADSQAVQSVMLTKHPVSYKTLLLLLVVVLVVVFVVVFVTGGATAGADNPPKTNPDPLHALEASGQRVLLHGIKVAIAKAPQDDF